MFGFARRRMGFLVLDEDGFLISPESLKKPVFFNKNIQRTVDIVLTHEESDWLDQIARERQDAFESQGVHSHKMNLEGYERNRIGCKSEYAVSKFLGVEWNPNIWKTQKDYANKREVRDVADKFEVRGTPVKAGHLVVKSSDPDETPFILVTVVNRKCVLAGWKYSQDCKHKRFLRDYGYDLSWKSYFVPQSMLNPIGGLPK
jgi:hypothetical protein